MKNLKNFLLAFCLIFCFISSKGDVIYTPVTHMGAIISLEGIASYELAFSQSNTLNLWGGAGFAFPLGGFFHPAYGTEAALELRQYFNKGTFQRFNLGLYAGLAYMDAPELYRGSMVDRYTSVGFVPGLKLTYKFQLTPKMIAEPYMSLSVPFYEEKFSEIFAENSDGGIVITLGVRIGFNQVKKLFEK